MIDLYCQDPALNSAEEYARHDSLGRRGGPTGSHAEHVRVHGHLRCVDPFDFVVECLGPEGCWKEYRDYWPELNDRVSHRLSLFLRHEPRSSSRRVHVDSGGLGRDL